jgi:hypothetical protein
MRKLLLACVCAISLCVAWALWPEDMASPVSLVTVKPSGIGRQYGNVDPDSRLIMLDGHPLALAGNYLLGDPQVVRLFDDWATEHAGEEFSVWKAQVLMDAEDTLPPEAMLQLEHWLDQYAEMNLAMQLLSIEGEPEWNKILADVSQLRGVYFADSDRNLFSHIEEIEDFTRDAMTAVAAGMDESALASLTSRSRELTPQERVRVQRWLEQIRTMTTAADWNSMDRDTRTRSLQAQVASLLESPSIDFGEENIGFLERYQTYSLERETLLAQGADQETLDALLERHFEGMQQTRALTLDRALAR